MNKGTWLICKIMLLLFLGKSIVLHNGYAQSTSTAMPAAFVVLTADSFNVADLQLQHSFTSITLCRNYAVNLPSLLYAKGYAAASVDSLWEVNDTVYTRVFLGNRYSWGKITTAGIDKKALTAAGFFTNTFTDKNINTTQLQTVQQRLLLYYENNGYPFARIYFDSITIAAQQLSGVLKAEPGYSYYIDSLRVIGSLKIKNHFLQQYLSITNGSLYNKAKLTQIGQRLLELPYVQQVQPPNLTMLGGGAIVNLFLTPKKSSQFNFLLGFLPAANQAQKFQLTADVNLNLKNQLGYGETILFNWQQLQQKSPRLNVGYQHPYIFKSKFGTDFLFELFKKDSSFFQINAQLGISYAASTNQSVKFFSLWQSSFLLANGVDTNQIKVTKTLPANIDVTASNFGIDYTYSKLDYRLNPAKGNEVKLTALAGIKNIKRNNAILAIKDPQFNYASLYDSLAARSYQLRVKLYAAHYFPSGKQGTLKISANTGVFVSPVIFRNEVFQIGGYRLLRGFDEESIYATQYGVATAEYRVRTALNSYFFVFTDVGAIKNKYQLVNLTTQHVSAGIGAVLETKLGLLNLSYAIGKRSDVPFNIRQASKIHFGYVNYF